MDDPMTSIRYVSLTIVVVDPKLLVYNTRSGIE